MPAVRKPKVVKENSERWLLTYSDLITLLLVFFIILYSISTTDARKFQDLTGALQKAFNNGSYQMVTIGGSPGTPKDTSGATQANAKQAMKKLQQALAKMLKQAGVAASVVTVGLSHEGIVLSLNRSLLFYPGDIALTPESGVVLSVIGTLLSAMSNSIRVEGNTDNQSEGTLSNWALSSLRAVSIVEYLSQHGVNSKRLQAEGLSQYNPLSPNSNKTPAGRARNRRADIVVLYNP
jgi:chemotaxis protein MotB